MWNLFVLLSGIAFACSCSKAPRPEPKIKSPSATVEMVNQYPGSIDWSESLLKTTLEIRRTFIQSNLVAVSEVLLHDLDEETGKFKARFNAPFADFSLEISADQEKELLKRGVYSQWVIAVKVTEIRQDPHTRENMPASRLVEGVCLNLKPATRDAR